MPRAFPYGRHEPPDSTEDLSSVRGSMVARDLLLYLSHPQILRGLIVDKPNRVGFISIEPIEKVFTAHRVFE